MDFNTEYYDIEIPIGVKSGDKFAVMIRGNRCVITCPSTAIGGDTCRFEISAGDSSTWKCTDCTLKNKLFALSCSACFKARDGIPDTLYDTELAKFLSEGSGGSAGGSAGGSDHDYEINMIYTFVCEVRTTDTNKKYTWDDVKLIVSMNEGGAETMVTDVTNRMLGGLHMKTLRQKAQTTHTGEWTCGICTFRNLKKNQNCFVCAAPK